MSSMNNLNREYLGQELLKQGFEIWFRYMFRILEQKPFIMEEIHQGLFKAFDDIFNLKVIRENINIPPRSGKTTLAEYFLTYIITLNPKANVIYTSFSQSLLGDISNKIMNILENPAYKAMYPTITRVESEEINPIDDFWREYLLKGTGKNTYSSKKIITKQGGVCLFASIGSQITGYGAGIRNSNKFSGCLIIDDPQKPSDIHSKIMRNKVERYFEETLLSRLNDSKTPIINIQQRLHKDDLSGILENKYNFTTLKRPLIDENGKCLLPKQYTNERIKELKVNNYMFSSQYQQEPIILGGQLIKREYFGYYPINTNYDYRRVIIAADTAMSVKESADFSCFIVGGITAQNRLHLLEIVHGKYEYPELKRIAINLYNKWQLDKKQASASGFYIEDRASGIQLIQDFIKQGMPIIPITVTKDKLARVEEILDFLASGQVLLPESENYSNNKLLLDECEAFTRDMSHTHDDIVDTLVHLINSSIAKRQVSILDVL